MSKSRIYVAPEEVKVRIESVDLDSNRMSLSMREGFGGGGGGGFRAPADLSAFEPLGRAGRCSTLYG